MSDKKAGPDGANMNLKRNLPSWMSSRDDESTSIAQMKSGANLDDYKTEEEISTNVIEDRGKACRHYNSSKKDIGWAHITSSVGASSFSKLLEGVIFVLSGFVNPERSTLRSQALEMGADYQPDWNSDCTLLVCAFPNTPKFRQVEADCGTIVAKEWITECYNQKKLVDIESYLMHAGKPWRKQGGVSGNNKGGELLSSVKSQIREEKHSKPNISAPPNNVASDLPKDCFSPSKLKKWAIDDLNETVSWLESQEQKPSPSEIKKIAAGGILACLQDAIDSLKKQQDIDEMTEQWMFIPRVVKELSKIDNTGQGRPLLAKEDLYRQATVCKQIYEEEYSNSENSLSMKNDTSDENGAKLLDAASHDSDETIEMTEEEIDQAYNSVAFKLHR